MKKLLIILLAFQMVFYANAQFGIVKQSLAIGLCDTCERIGAVTYTPISNFMILGAADEFRKYDDRTLNIHELNNVSRMFINKPSFSLSFVVPNDKLQDTLPSAITDPNKVTYNQLEFFVVSEGKLMTGWTKLASLPAETEFSTAHGNHPGLAYASKIRSFLVGKYELKPGGHLIVKVRKINTNQIIQHIYVKRMDTSPEILAAKEFPAGTAVQQILNRQWSKDESMIITGNDLSVREGNSLLLSFDPGFENPRRLEYSFTPTNDSWQPVVERSSIESLSPVYIFIEKPGEKKTNTLYLRYADDPENIKKIKFIVRPRLIQATWFKISASILLAFLLFMIGVLFAKRRSKKQLQKLKQKKDDLENTLQLLSGQFNPHFLFNTLNSIQNLVQKEEIQKASDYISVVATFLRTVMTIGKKEFISLQEELDISETYLHLEQHRKQFHYEIIHQCDIDFRTIDIPPLLLQPVLENSIHHGFKQTLEIKYDIIISVRCEHTDIHITIKDSGIGYDTLTTKNGYGLELVEKRINAINQKKAVRILMQVNSSEQGTETTFILKDWL